MKSIIVLLLSTVVFFVRFDALFAQDKQKELFEVESISFFQNEKFEKEEFLNIMATRESPNWLSQALYGLFGEKVGTPPAYFEPLAFESDIERIKKIYVDNGYFDVNIIPEVNKNNQKKYVTLSIIIRENEPVVIDSVTILGIEKIPETVKAEITSSALLQKNTHVVIQTVNREIARIIALLQNNGFPLARYNKESSSVLKYSSHHRATVVLQFETGREFIFGDLNYTIGSSTADTLEYDIFAKQLDFKRGELFSVEKKKSSERNLNRLGVFDAARLDILFPADSIKSKNIMLNLVGTLRPKYDLSPEISFSDENNAFNIGFGGGYKDRNFFGSARNFRSRLTFRFQSLQQWDFSNIFAKSGWKDPSVIGGADLTFSVTQPYMFSRAMSANISLSFRVEKLPEYVQNIIRSKFGITNQFATYTQGFLEWTLVRSQVEFLADSIQVSDDKFNEHEETRPQFNSILSATLQRDKTNDIFSPSRGFFHSVTLEESGILPLLIQSIQPDLPFTQFYNASLLGRWYFETGRDNYSLLASKIKIGYQDKYGESKADTLRTIPLYRRYFAGGSGSVRGWRARDLGDAPQNYVLGGNFLVEGNIEERINITRGFGKFFFLDLEKVWFVAFCDVGNVWSQVTDFTFTSLAVATGFGIRYNTFFGPFRFDVGLKGYDPASPTGQRTIFQKQFFGETFRNAVYHFGIGHAF